MRHFITVWCPNLGVTRRDAHEIPLLITIKYSDEDAEVFGAVPQHCPVCDHKLLELEKDGMLMEIGERADEIIHKRYPNIFMRVFPSEYRPTRMVRV